MTGHAVGIGLEAFSLIDVYARIFFSEFRALCAILFAGQWWLVTDG